MVLWSIRVLFARQYLLTSALEVSARIILALVFISVASTLWPSLPWVVMPRLHESGPVQGSYGQPRDTTQHLLGPI